MNWRLVQCNWTELKDQIMAHWGAVSANRNRMRSGKAGGTADDTQADHSVTSNRGTAQSESIKERHTGESH